MREREYLGPIGTLAGGAEGEVTGAEIEDLHQVIVGLRPVYGARLGDLVAVARRDGDRVAEAPLTIPAPSEPVRPVWPVRRLRTVTVPTDPPTGA